MSAWNAALAVAVALPSFVFYRWFLGRCSGAVCQWCFSHPLLLLNAMFFLNVDVLFWIISLIQGSTWLIDPYWTFLPVAMAHFLASHPLSKADPWRSKLLLTLVWIWSIRLTHSYFRRENWCWGAREDWRFSEMRTKYGKHWWWISFFAVYVSQQIFLVGICLPIYAVHQSRVPLNYIDGICVLLCLAGITMAYFADTQLHDFVQQKRRAERSSVLVLEQGLWRHSRHPNYFGEQLWWWGVAMFGWNVGRPWTMLGAAVNSSCLAYVTFLVERRMLADPRRAEAYAKYRASTSVWIPWFKPSIDP